VLGWSAFAGVLRAGAGIVVPPLAPDTVLALGIGSAACSLALVLLLAIPAALTARALAVALRVGRDMFARDRDRETADEPAWTRRRPPAMIVEDESELEARPRARRPSLQPFSSAEMRFFSEGDALGD